MTTQIPDDVPYLYLFQVDLFRVGNSESPRIDRVRANKDVDVYEQNGILMVRANGKGISLFTEEAIKQTRFEGWAWKIPRGTPLPSGLGLFNDHPGHFMICPVNNMLVDEYKALLSKIALACERVMKVPVR